MTAVYDATDARASCAQELGRELRTTPPPVYLVYGNGGLDAPGGLDPAYTVLVDDLGAGHEEELMQRVRYFVAPVLPLVTDAQLCI